MSLKAWTNIVTWSTKIIKGIGFHLPRSSAVLGKYEKLTFMDALKVHFQRFFRDQMEFISTHWHRLRHFCKFMWSIFTKATQSLDFIKPNLIRKLAHKVKYINQINGVLIMFFQKFENKIHALFKCHRFTNSSSAVADALFEWFWPFCGVCTQRVEDLYLIM